MSAHEAAHVIQQRAGVHLPGGVGQTDDVYEQHAHAVADLVVRGQPSEALLDRFDRDGRHRSAQAPVQREGKSSQPQPAFSDEWTPRKEGSYPMVSVDPRVIKSTTIYRGNPPPPKGWKYWPRQRQPKPQHAALAQRARHSAMGAFIQEIIDGELVGVRTEWHEFTTINGQDIPGLFHGASLMPPLEQPRPADSETKPAETS